MRVGKYWGSAEHKKLISEEKKEVLQHIKHMTERYLITQDPTTKKIIEHWHEFYKQLVNYHYDTHSK